MYLYKVLFPFLVVVILSFCFTNGQIRITSGGGVSQRSCQNLSGSNKWLCEQRSHQVKSLSLQEKLRVCRKTSWNQIEALLDPIVNTTRVPGSQENHHVAAFIENTLNSYGFTVERDAFEAQTPLGPKRFSNIIGTSNRSAPRRLMMACHYDSKYFSRGTFFGATDSALPCALLLDLAVTLSSYLQDSSLNPLKEDVALQLVFFDGEEAFRQWSDEDSLYGSRHLADRWAKQPYDGLTELSRIDIMVLLDLLGAQNPSLLMYDHQATRFFLELSKIETELKSALCISNLNTMFDSRRSIPGNYGIQDDHLPFYQRGVKIVHVIASPFPLVWHVPCDNGVYSRCDNKEALHIPTVRSLASIFRVFVAEYLHLVV